MSGPQWNGFVHRDGDSITVTIRDTWGWVMEFRGTRGTDAEGRSGYILSQPEHSIPELLRLPVIEDEVPA